MPNALSFQRRERPATPGAATETLRFAATHYSPAEVARLWSVSDDFVRKIFEKEPGVLVLGATQRRKGKRPYTTLRIPEDVLERVHRRLSKV